ncbi:MAG: thioredoxin [Rhodobiaceae bacterium]|nr:hypothetical protein [Caldilineaceae bacterium]MCB1471513.1 thioredoxin [Rhodobiaceae bacterium]MCC0053880.1 thioredoxin [Rhodobiaceae bacterium]
MSIYRTLLALVVLAAAAVVRVPAGAAELVMFEKDGCGWCEEWHRTIAPIYPKTAEGRIAPLRRVDMNSPRPDDLAGISVGPYTPTFVLVDNGKEVGRITGYPGEDFFWGLLAQIVGKLGANPAQQS